MPRFAVRAAHAIAAAVIAGPVFAQQTYVLTDIGPHTDIIGGHSININASGQLAGFYEDTNGNDHAWVWNPAGANSSAGTYSLLPVPSSTTSSYATGINGSGQVVGWRMYQSGTYKYRGKTYPNIIVVAVLWQANGSSTDLPGIGSVAPAINDAGEIVCTTSLVSNGKVYPLPAGDSASINGSGQVVGENGNNSGYLWTPAQPNGTGGTSIALPFRPSQVNNLGQVAGPPDWMGPGVPAFYTPSTGTQYLGPQTSQGDANGINNLSQVVGEFTSGTVTGAFLWDSTHGLRFLNDTTQFTIVNGSGWSFTWADGINDFGQIAGFGTDPSGATRFFLLTPQ